MSEGKAVPDFELPMTSPHRDGNARGNQRLRLSAFHGHPLILYFCPKGSTPGCTGEGLQFREWRGLNVPGHAAEVLAFAEIA